MENVTNREKVIVRTSVIGIICNFILVAFKATVGILANSISIILDAVNNFSDAFSSVLTIIGTKLANKKPDDKHPYGYGRIEYITSVTIALIILVAAVTSGIESVQKIINPGETDHSIAGAIVIGAAILIKLCLGLFVKGQGKKVDSQSLVASGTDAFMDAILSAATLVAVIISLVWHINIEGYLGVIISIFIAKAGVEILAEGLGSLIGTKADIEITDKLKALIKTHAGVKGAYDVILHSYGPNKIIGSVHVEVEDDMTAREMHALTHEIVQDVYDQMEIILTVGFYASNTSDPLSLEMQNKINEIIKDYPDVFQMHGFFKGDDYATFDLVIKFKADNEKIKGEVASKMHDLYPNYEFIISVDSKYTD